MKALIDALITEAVMRKRKRKLPAGYKETWQAAAQSPDMASAAPGTSAAQPTRGYDPFIN